MRLYPVRRDCCPADKTFESAMIERRRGDRAKMVFHRHGEARFWHWHDHRVASPYLHDHLNLPG